MKTSESILQLIKSKKQNKTIKTGNWKATRKYNIITIYYYDTLVAYYNINNKRLLLVYDYSMSTKCGLTKIKNELLHYSLIKSLVYTDKNYRVIKDINL